MRELVISLNSIDKVKSFVSIAAKFDAEIDLVSGRYVIDGKSIMGIFSMDLPKSIILRIHESGEKAEEIVKAFDQYKVIE